MASFWISEEWLNFLHLGDSELKCSWNCYNNGNIYLFHLSHNLNHFHPLQVENYDSNSLLVVDEDYNGKFRLELVNAPPMVALGLSSQFNHCLNIPIFHDIGTSDLDARRESLVMSAVINSRPIHFFFKFLNVCIEWIWSTVTCFIPSIFYVSSNNHLYSNLLYVLLFNICMMGKTWHHMTFCIVCFIVHKMRINHYYYYYYYYYCVYSKLISFDCRLKMWIKARVQRYGQTYYTCQVNNNYFDYIKRIRCGIVVSSFTFNQPN